VDSPEQIAETVRAQQILGGPSQALIVANPLPPDEQMDPELHDRVLTEGLRLLAERGIAGQEVTPFLLAHFHEATAGESLDANIRLILRNAALAARAAVACAAT
jgi:pseudouridylate synthase